MKNLKKLLKETLENKICSVQALDVEEDREKVLKELLKTLETHTQNKNEVIDALNRIDELACKSVQPDKAEKLRDDYNLVFNFIT